MIDSKEVKLGKKGEWVWLCQEEKQKFLNGNIPNSDAKVKNSVPHINADICADSWKIWIYRHKLGFNTHELYTWIIYRDVNGAGRVRIVAPLYPTRWINIRPVSVLIFVEYPLCGYPYFFFHIYEYLRVFIKLFRK